MSTEDKSVSDPLLIAALNEYWPKSQITVMAKRNVEGSSKHGVVNGPISYVPVDSIGTVKPKANVVKVSKLLARVEGDSKTLVMTMTTELGTSFQIKLPMSELPIPGSPTVQKYGLEYSIADELLLWLEESLNRYTPDEVDGQNLIDL